MTFKEFLDKYLGMIIGAIVALLIIFFGGVFVVECIALIVLCAWVGCYVQRNKASVRTKLKGAIDQVLKDDEDDE